MATPRFLVFFSLLLLVAFNFSTGVLARTTREMVAVETNGEMGRKLTARQLDISWRGNYSPPPPNRPPPPPPYFRIPCPGRSCYPRRCLPP
ncbi:hypothetical protein IC575_013572 [Cucumis melo]